MRTGFLAGPPHPLLTGLLDPPAVVSLHECLPLQAIFHTTVVLIT